MLLSNECDNVEPCFLYSICVCQNIRQVSTGSPPRYRLRMSDGQHTWSCEYLVVAKSVTVGLKCW